MPRSLTCYVVRQVSGGPPKGDKRRTDRTTKPTLERET